MPTRILLALLCAVPVGASKETVVPPAEMPTAGPAAAAAPALPVSEGLVRVYLAYRTLLAETNARGGSASPVRGGEYAGEGRAGKLEEKLRSAVAAEEGAVARLVAEGDPLDREMACLVIGYARDKPAAAAALLKALDDPHHRIHEEALRTLFALAHLDRISISQANLAPLLEHGWGCQKGALAILGLLAHDRGVAPEPVPHLVHSLVRLSDSAHPGIRRPAQSLLRRMAGVGHEQAAAREWARKRFGTPAPTDGNDEPRSIAVRAVPNASRTPVFFLDADRCRHFDEMEGKLAIWARSGGEVRRSAAFVVVRADVGREVLAATVNAVESAGVDEIFPYPRGAWDLDGTRAFDPSKAKAAEVEERVVLAFSEYRGAAGRSVSGTARLTARAGEWWSPGDAGTIEALFRESATAQREPLLAFLRHGASGQQEMAACVLGWTGAKRQTLSSLLAALDPARAPHAVHPWIGWHLAAWCGIPSIRVPASAAAALAAHDAPECRAKGLLLATRLAASQGKRPWEVGDRRSLGRAAVAAARSEPLRGEAGALLARLAGRTAPPDVAAWAAFADALP